MCNDGLATMTSFKGDKRTKTLHRIAETPAGSLNSLFQQDHPRSSNGGTQHGLVVPVAQDLRKKGEAMMAIGLRPFVSDATTPHFLAAQKWIEDCGREVSLPRNFCGGLVIMRFYRMIVPADEQTPDWMHAIYEAAAAYDFAFLALAHADDESDLTSTRDGTPTRFTTHPNTRAVDGINLLLSGITAMQEVLQRWPSPSESTGVTTHRRHPLSPEITETLVRALREASFPILLDRAGLGHDPEAQVMSSGLAPILIDDLSMHRVEAFARHRAKTYFMRATEIAILLAGYNSIDPNLRYSLERIYDNWGSMGAAADDLQDIFLDFSAGIHSSCTVLAHLCVAAEKDLRPHFRRDVPEPMVRNQRERLHQLFGTTGNNFNTEELFALVEEIDLRRALSEYLITRGKDFASSVFDAAVGYQFDPRLIIEIVAEVSADPRFRVPDAFFSVLNAIPDEATLEFLKLEAGKYFASYVLETYWPRKPT